MEILIIAAVTFALCYGLDKGYTKLFRSQAQHKSGLAVRLSKRYAAFGVILMVFGLAAVFAGLTNGLILSIGGGIVIAIGAGLVVYYATFGIFYDADGFILSTFGRKSGTYRFADIKGQQLYVSYGSIILELVMTDGRSVQLQLAMEGVVAFLDHAYGAWLRQTGRRVEDCGFHDTDNSCWFPALED